MNRLLGIIESDYAWHGASQHLSERLYNNSSALFTAVFAHKLYSRSESQLAVQGSEGSESSLIVTSMQRIVPCKAPCGVVCLQRAPTPTQHALLAGPCPPQPVFHSACIRSLTTSRGMPALPTLRPPRSTK